MFGMRAAARGLLTATVLGLGLGCTGMMTGAMNLAGIEMKMGADAVHPPDFPAMPLTVGEKMMSLKMSAKGDQVNMPEQIPMPEGMPLDASSMYDIEVVMYTVPSAQRPDAVAGAVSQAQAAGFTEIDESPPTDDEIKEMFVSTGSDAIFAVIGSESGADSSVILVRMKPKAEDAPAPE